MDRLCGSGLLLRDLLAFQGRAEAGGTCAGGHASGGLAGAEEGGEVSLEGIENRAGKGAGLSSLASLDPCLLPLARRCLRDRSQPALRQARGYPTEARPRPQDRVGAPQALGREA